MKYEIVAIARAVIEADSLESAELVAKEQAKALIEASDGSNLLFYETESKVISKM